MSNIASGVNDLALHFQITTYTTHLIMKGGTPNE